MSINITWTSRVFHLFANITHSEAGYLIEIRERGNPLDGLQVFSPNLGTAVEGMRREVKRLFRSKQSSYKGVVMQSQRVARQLQNEQRINRIEFAEV